METLKKSIHGFFQLVLSRRMSARDGLRESTTERVVRVGASCLKRETLNCSAFPYLCGPVPVCLPIMEDTPVGQ
jgi:hypothetical protein